MKNEIERKFFIKEMPNLSGIQPKKYERYILKSDGRNEVRISRVDDAFVYEEKNKVSSLERTREKKILTQKEFDKLKRGSSEAILRDRYNIAINPDIAIQMYHGRFEGLIRAEVEFDSEDAAKSFSPLSWMGKEMTGLPISNDSKLIKLSDEEFRQYLK